MRILWVKMGGLWPATTGGRVRSLNTISELARDHQVTVITTHGHGDDPQGLKQQLPHCEAVVSVPYAVPKRGSAAFAAAVAGSWFSHYPVDLWKWRVAAVRREVDNVLAQGNVDLCIADFLFAAANVPMPGNVPVLLFEHNVEYLIWQRLANLETTGWKRALFEMEWRKLRACEREAVANAALTIAVSDDDRDRLAEMSPGSRVVSIQTGVNTTYFTPRPDVETPMRLVFSGSMDWHPNEDAVCYFVETILPRNVIRKLSEEEMSVYRMPYLEREARLPTLTWPRQIPVEGEPAEPRVRVWPAPRLLAMVRPVAVVKEIGPVRVRLLVSPVALATVKPPAPIWIGLASVRLPPTGWRLRFVELFPRMMPVPKGPEGSPAL